MHSIIIDIEILVIILKSLYPLKTFNNKVKFHDD